MIAPQTDAGEGTRASFVATTFDLPEGAAPILHVSAQGLYCAFVNGRRVDDDYLTPGWTCQTTGAPVKPATSPTSSSRARTGSRSGWAMADSGRP